FACLWRPEYRVLPEPAAGGPRGGAAVRTLEVRTMDPVWCGLEGLEVRAWVGVVEVGPDGTPLPGEVPAPVSFLEFDRGQGAASAPARAPVSPGGPLTGRAELAPPPPGTALVLGVRLVPDPAAGPGYLTMARYLGLATEIPFSYTVTPGRPGGPATAVGEAEGGPEGGEDVVVDAPGGPQEEARAGPGDDGSHVPEGRPDEAPGGEPGQGTGSPAGSVGSPSGAEVEIVPTPEPPPLVNVIRVTKMTTRKRERRVYHARWEWDFGDGERWVDDDPRHTKVTVTHTYDIPGTYTVRAVSLANDGRLLRELSWTVEAGRDGPDGTGEGFSFTFEAETVVEPEVVLRLDGPVKWITGRPARFVLTAQVSRPPHTRRQVIRAYPGWSFDVVWEKPGRFEVRAAVTVRQSYEFPERRLTLWNTYVVVTKVEVFVPGLTE
ncbi:MAG TPA: hypothetical protein DHW14_08235, partial [Clostridiales bacterium]|nr:hypothetical protein [Clostridiales bacterium]